MRLLFAVIVAVCLFAAPALAQDTSIPLTSIVEPFRPLLDAVVSTLAAAVTGWLALRLNRWLGLNIEARHRDALQTALQNAAGLALQRAGRSIEGVAFPLGRPEIKDAVDYVLDAVPDAIGYFDLDADTIGEKIMAKLGVAKLAKPDGN